MVATFYSKKNVVFYLLFVLILSIFAPISSTAADDEEQIFNISGEVFSSEGETAGNTYVKLIPRASIQTGETGSYEINDVYPGEYTIRAYFMNNGHTVVYRKIMVSDNIDLDWVEGSNWATVEVLDSNYELIEDSSDTSITLVENGQIEFLDNGRVEFGPFNVDNYYTLRAYYGDLDQSEHYLHFKMERGSNPGDFYPDVNDFELVHGKNSRYGFVTNPLGTPLEGILVSDGQQSFVTNSDGFYLLQNLDIGNSYNITFNQFGKQISEPLEETISSGPGWLNQTIDIDLNLPGNVSFVTPVQTLPMISMELEWLGSEYTDYYSVYSGVVAEENLIYRGLSKSFIFEPSEPGMIDFNVVANNSNGSTENLNSLRIIFLPPQSSENIWNVGMNWEYRVEYTPSGTIRDVKMTMIGTEIISDSFGLERDSFLLRLTGDYQLPDEKSYRWVDPNTLLNIHTYWSDDPISSSYFTEGTLGWNFTDESGHEGDLLTGEETLSMHFNRTNVIGVPGHPDGYADTFNTVYIQDDVVITTPAGVFNTRYIRIIDNTDNVISWELWYNDSVKNWVKIIDRLSGSHSDKVEYELTSYDAPTTPQFITQEEVINTKNYQISWADYPGVNEYQLLQNNEIIFEGNETSFLIENNDDGIYSYLLRGMMEGYFIEGEKLEIEVNYIPPKPILALDTQLINEGDSITISWSHIEGAEWYEIIIQDEEGNIQQMYNGSDNQVTLDGLSIGQNRIRANGMINGKVSDYSSSVFVTVLENEESSFPIGTLIFGFMLIALFTSNYILRENKNRRGE